MGRVSTRDIERLHFERFRKAYDLPAGEVAYGDKPDIILQTAIGRIGIEVTQFYREDGRARQSEQCQTPMRKSIVREAEQRYRATGGNVELVFNFNRAVPITPTRRKQLPAELAEVGRRIDALGRGEPVLAPPQPMPEIADIHFSGDGYSDPHWRIFQTSTLAKMSVADLEAIVRDKERKSRGYSLCSAYWLLVLVDWTDRGQEQEIRLDAVAIASDVFQKILVYKWGFEHIIEVKS